MFTRWRVLSFGTAIACVSLACDDVAPSPPRPPPPLGQAGSGGSANGGAGAPVATSPDRWIGSYDLRFTEATSSPPFAQGDEARSSRPPAPNVRLDLRVDAAGLPFATLAGRGLAASRSTVDIVANALVVRGETYLSDERIRDRLEVMTLPLAPDGTLAATFVVRGERRIDHGDVYPSATLEARGSIARDSTAPTIELAPVDGEGPHDVLLPWEPFVIVAGEPLPSEAFVAALSLSSVVDPEPVATSFTAGAATPGAELAGVAHVTGRLDDWDAAGTGAAAGADGITLFSLRSAGGVADPVGRVTAPRETALRFLALPPAQTGFDLAAPTPGYRSWGAVGRRGLPGDDTGLCPGGCVVLGAFDDTHCGAERVGLATRLVRAGRAQTLRIRYRVMFAEKPAVAAGGRFSLRFAEPAGSVQKLDVYGPKPSVAPAGPLAMDGLGWITDQATFEAPLPLGDTPLGLALLAGTGPDVCTEGPAWPVERVAVLVDGIVIE